MSRTLTNSAPLSVRRPADELWGWLAGVAFTFALFFALAHFAQLSPRAAPTEFDDLRQVSVPFAAPPPPPRPIDQPVEDAVELPPLSGIEPGASDSAVHLAVVPPEFAALLPEAPLPPRATAQLGRLHSDLKPRIDVEIDPRHVFQTTEVDQPPRAVVREAPAIPRKLFGDARVLRVVLLLLIDQNGRAISTRVLESSGNPQVDALAMQSVADDWQFSPAIRRGKKVRCLAQQGFRFVLPAASKFDAR